MLQIRDAPSIAHSTAKRLQLGSSSRFRVCSSFAGHSSMQHTYKHMVHTTIPTAPAPVTLPSHMRCAHLYQPLSHPIQPQPSTLHTLNTQQQPSKYTVQPHRRMSRSTSELSRAVKKNNRSKEVWKKLLTRRHCQQPSSFPSFPSSPSAGPMRDRKGRRVRQQDTQ